MWLRQEYKPEKQRFEKPFELKIGIDLLPRQADGTKREFIDKSVLRLEQSYTALGTTVWDGSIALAKMFDNRETFPCHYLQTCRVLELGAGCGLVGIYICLLGAKMTFLTDQKCCVKTLETNVESNIPQLQRDKIKVMEYSWGTNTDELTKDGFFLFGFSLRSTLLTDRLLAVSSEHSKIGLRSFRSKSVRSNQ